MSQQGGDDGAGRSGRSSIPLAATIRPDQALQVDQLVRDGRARAALKGSLLVIAGAPADIGTHWVVDGTATIGRDPAALLLRDGQISRRHVSVTEQGHQIAEQGHHFIVTDLGSTNGTSLNSTPLAGNQPTPLHDGDKIYLGLTVIKFMLVDPTEAAYLHRMERLAGTDELTDLLAKHRFDSLLAEATRSALATTAPLSLLMLDMDGLKTINDRHGHQMGAHTISQVGRMIGQLVAGRGEACRFGGDEFCVMLPAMPLPGALQVGEEIRAAVAAAIFSLAAATVSATISIGAAELGGEVRSLETLMARADAALYRAKAQGRNRVSS